MKIALLGYGKMGREIELVALQRKHEIVFIADEHNSNYNPEDIKKADVAIEFTTPESAIENIMKCFEAGIPAIVGTTGWYERFEEIKKICIEGNQSLFCATNFSIGVNIFFEINKKLAQLMNSHNEYEVRLEEIHHTQKLDAPSGTAITLANDIISNSEKKKKWVSVLETEKKGSGNADEIEILSVRKNKIPGTHKIKYDSEIDCIEITHIAKNRKGFATGAVLAAEWIVGKKGIFGMKDLLKL